MNAPPTVDHHLDLCHEGPLSKRLTAYGGLEPPFDKEHDEEHDKVKGVGQSSFSPLFF